MVIRIINRQSWVLIVALLTVTASSSCYYDTEDKLYPGGCNTDNVTYRGTVLPIIELECYSCHDALTQNGGVNLEGYDHLLTWVANGKVLSAIRHESDFPMPDGEPKLDTCTIAKIQKWIVAGAQDN